MDDSTWFPKNYYHLNGRQLLAYYDTLKAGEIFCMSEILDKKDYGDRSKFFIHCAPTPRSRGGERYRNGENVPMAGKPKFWIKPIRKPRRPRRSLRNG